MILEENGPSLRWRFGGANVCDVVLDGVLGDREADFEEFTLDSFGSPQSILLGHLLDQRDGLGSDSRTTSTITRFEFPEETEALTVPTEKGVGLEDVERFSPILHPTGEEDQPEAIGLRKGRLF
jgi:hypothetical protein